MIDEKGLQFPVDEKLKQMVMIGRGQAMYSCSRRQSNRKSIRKRATTDGCQTVRWDEQPECK